MKTTRLLSSIAVAGLLLASCSGGDDDDGDDGSEATVTTAQGTAAQDQAEVGRHLLALDDLQSDDPLEAPWEEGDVQDGVDIELPSCVVEEPFEAGARTSMESKFVKVNQFRLPSLEQDLTRYEDAEGAAAAFDAAVARLDGCGTPVFVFEGTPSDGTIQRLDLTLGGEQSAAWRTSVLIAGAQVAVTTIHVQQGELAMSLVHTDISEPDPAVLEGFAATAIAKLGDG